MTDINKICDLILTLKNEANYEVSISQNILHLIINDNSYDLAYTDFNHLKKMFKAMIYAEKTKKHKNFTKLIQSKFPDVSLKHSLYLNFMNWYEQIVLTNPFILENNVFNNKHWDVTVSTYWKHDALELNTRQYLTKSSDASKILDSLLHQDLIVEIKLNEQWRLIYVLKMYDLIIYHNYYKNNQLDEQGLIDYYTNLIQNFYHKINNSLTNTKLDMIFQVIKLNYNLTYMSDWTYNIGWFTKKVSNQTIILNKLDELKDGEFFSDAYTLKNNHNILPIVFKYDWKTQELQDDGFTLINYNDDHLKIAHKTFDKWLKWYTNHHKINNQIVNLKTALWNYEFTNNDLIYDFKNIYYYKEGSSIAIFYQLSNAELSLWKTKNYAKILLTNPIITDVVNVQGGFVVRYSMTNMKNKDAFITYSLNEFKQHVNDAQHQIIRLIQHY